MRVSFSPKEIMMMMFNCARKHSFQLTFFRMNSAAEMAVFVLLSSKRTIKCCPLVRPNQVENGDVKMLFRLIYMKSKVDLISTKSTALCCAIVRRR